MVDECKPKDNGTAGLRRFLGIIERTDLNLRTTIYAGHRTLFFRLSHAEFGGLFRNVGMGS